MYHGIHTYARLSHASPCQSPNHIFSQPSVLVLLRPTHRPDALAATLSAIAATARKAGQHPQAAAALAQLSTLLSHASSQPSSAAGGMEAGGSGSGGGGSSGWLVAATSPEAPWVLESCKLLWARVSGGHDTVSWQQNSRTTMAFTTR